MSSPRPHPFVQSAVISFCAYERGILNALMMEAVNTSETSVIFYELHDATSRRHSST
jgi:hypothetical protein